MEDVKLEVLNCDVSSFFLIYSDLKLFSNSINICRSSFQSFHKDEHFHIYKLLMCHNFVLQQDVVEKILC